MAASKVKIRIRLKGYDHSLVDQAAEKIVDTAKSLFGKPKEILQNVV